MSNREKHRSPIGWSDVLMNLAIGFLILFMISVQLINPIKKEASPILKKAEIIVTMNWDDGMDVDLDLWVRDPNNSIVSFRNREAGFMNLEKDDLGNLNDVAWVDGIPVVIPLNREVVTFRGVVPGEYIVNVHSYRKGEIGIITAKVEVIRLNPYKVLYTKSIEVFETGEEHTIIRITLDKDYNVSNLTELPIRFVEISGSGNANGG